MFPFGWRKDVYWLTISNITNTTLTLKLLPNKRHYLIDEDLWLVGKKIKFSAKKDSCYEILKKENYK
tara:strand:+ start:504 stop:704 length:201 start_codon:yes stop_codon:yes gene_type:complete